MKQLEDDVRRLISRLELPLDYAKANLEDSMPIEELYDTQTYRDLIESQMLIKSLKKDLAEFKAKEYSSKKFTQKTMF